MAKWVLRILMLTCRLSIHGKENVSLKGRQIIAFWHNRLTIVTEILRHLPKEHAFAAFISKSRDGEIMATLTTSFKNGHVIRVPHDARSTAFQTLIQRLKYDKKTILITPDGPRGPPLQIKPGIIEAMHLSQATIIPLTWTASRYWQLSTWDKLRIPKPFSHVIARFGTPIFYHQKDAKEALKAALMDESDLANISS